MSILIILLQLFLIITPLNEINNSLNYNIEDYIIKLAKLINYACNQTKIC